LLLAVGIAGQEAGRQAGRQAKRRVTLSIFAELKMPHERDAVQAELDKTDAA
jgi:hypothetical protein